MDTKPICPKCGQPLPVNAPKGLCPSCLLQAGVATGTQSNPGGSKNAGSPGFTPPEPAELARFFPQLEILGLIGHGGMGAVYRARQKQLDRIVALKILPPGVSQDPSFAERFVREAQALAKLNHPGIVTLYEFGQADGLFYFLMEYVDGVSLARLMAQQRLSPREALAIVPQICQALQYAHDRGIVHRDIKPQNILVSCEGQVKIADFGVAKILALSGEGAGSPETAGTAATQSGRVVGTPQYMAPEQLDRPSEVDHRADIYSLGVVLYQMLTGQLPAGPIEPPSRKVQIDVRLDEIVLRALEREPTRRYQQASEVQTQIETVLSGSAPASASAKTNPVPLKLSPLVLAAAAWLLLFGGSCLLMYSRAGWALMHSLRRGPEWLAVSISLLAHLAVMLGPVGIPALGIVALRQIRRAQGRYYGLGLGLFVTLFFPLALVNGWMLRLGYQAASQMSTWGEATGAATGFPRWPMIITGLLGVIASVLVTRWTYRLVNRPLPPAPAASQPRSAPTPQPLATTLKRIGPRLLLVIILDLILTETMEQGTLHWKESSQELLLMLTLPASLGAILWALWPALSQRKQLWLWAPASIALFVGLQTMHGFYNFHVRPNLGLYRESEWVNRTGGWQREFRLKIAKNLWNRKLVGPEFTATKHAILEVDQTRPVRLLDLDAGMETDPMGVEPGQVEDWARERKLDLMWSKKDGYLSIAGLSLGVGFVPKTVWEKDTPQNVVDYFTLERNPPRERVALWPPEDYSHDVQGWPKKAPVWLTNHSAAYFFRTRQGALGLLNLTSSPTSSNVVHLTYKLVPPSGY